MENKTLLYSGSNDIDSFATSERKRKSRTSDSSDVASKFHIPSSLKQVSSFQGTSGGGNAHDLSACEKSPMSEKLWVGSLQLNSSITVSAVAFFKSGERLLDVSWSKFVEVKGKVRLDAFEKYIQDLSRSRTRGLMVISLCAKEGSSEKGLKGLKEVSKAYIKGERVGFAQVSPGVDVYLCPLCDKIFSLVAKYGFFKGMAASEDKSESLIGCVVWRKNQTAAGSVSLSKQHQKSPKQHKKSPSGSSPENAGGGERCMSSSSTLPIQNSISASVRPSLAVQSMNISDKKVDIGNCTATTVWETPSGPAKSTIAVEPQESKSFSLSSQTSKAHHLENEAASFGRSVSDKPKAALELPNKFISVPSNVVKQKMPTADDDDLPEYDFGTARGIAFTSASMPLGVPTADSRLQIERVMDVDGHVLLSLPVTHLTSASNSRSDNLNNTMLSSANRGMPLPNVTPDHESWIHVSGRSEGRQNFQKYATTAAVGAPPFASSVIPPDKLHKRFIFSDNDDNMPEWLPPQQQRPSSSAPTHSQFPSKGFPLPYHQSTNCRLPLSLPIQNGSNFLSGFGDNAGLRPPPDGRNWRP